MASQVKSQLSDKIYESTLDDLMETDQGLEVDLYKINIFNKDIHISPGKIMNDAKKDIYYCFVYAIKDKKVAAKIGVYENFQQSNMLKITEDLLNHILVIVENAEKQKEVEEISENIVIIFSHFSKELKDQFRPIFEKLASSEKKPGLSSRTKFKYMDLIGK